MPAKPRLSPGAVASFVRGMRTSIRANSAAYGYSVTITAALAALSSLDGAPGLPDIFLFLAGAGAAFTAVELVATKGFRITEASEPSDVVILGTSFNLFSIAAGVGGAALVAWLLAGWTVWPVGSFAATLVYLFVVGLEMALAERVED